MISLDAMTINQKLVLNFKKKKKRKKKNVNLEHKNVIVMRTQNDSQEATGQIEESILKNDCLEATGQIEKSVLNNYS